MYREYFFVLLFLLSYALVSCKSNVSENMMGSDKDTVFDITDAASSSIEAVVSNEYIVSFDNKSIPVDGSGNITISISVYNGNPENTYCTASCDNGYIDKAKYQKKSIDEGIFTYSVDRNMERDSIKIQVTDKNHKTSTWYYNVLKRLDEDGKEVYRITQLSS
jgi:lipoprotein